MKKLLLFLILAVILSGCSAAPEESGTKNGYRQVTAE